MLDVYLPTCNKYVNLSKIEKRDILRENPPSPCRAPRQRQHEPGMIKQSEAPTNSHHRQGNLRKPERVSRLISLSKSDVQSPMNANSASAKQPG